MRKLTDNIEVNEIAAYRLCADLTFVDAGVSFLRPLYLQSPLVIVSMVIRLEALVASVRVASNCQDVNVPVSDPRHLKS
jgi:hypothetical protein